MSWRARLLLLSLPVALGCWFLVYRFEAPAPVVAVVIAPAALTALCPQRLLPYWLAILALGSWWLIDAARDASGEGLGGLFAYLFILIMVLLAVPVAVIRGLDAAWRHLADRPFFPPPPEAGLEAPKG